MPPEILEFKNSVTGLQRGGSIVGQLNRRPGLQHSTAVKTQEIPIRSRVDGASSADEHVACGGIGAVGVVKASIVEIHVGAARTSPSNQHAGNDVQSREVCTQERSLKAERSYQSLGRESFVVLLN